MTDSANTPGEATPNESGWGQDSTLFIHVPKSGGTTLDSIFRDHYYNTPMLPTTPFDLFGKFIRQYNDPAYRYIGGHIPLSVMDATRFKKRMTVLRDPIENISSGISYVNKINGVPQDELTDTEKSGMKVLSYKKFFTTHFDTERYLIDLDYGIAKGMRNYLFECAAIEAFENIKKFTHVFDFSQFDGEVKRFLIEEQYFPYAQLAKKRQYSYQPDLARAKALLTEFDEQFYQLSTPLFKKLPEAINRQYEQYREDYCRHRGLALRVHEGRNLDLRMPLGTGWYPAEISDRKTPFRWSEPGRATIEIPVATAGLYAVYLYINPEKVKDIRFDIATILHPREFQATLINEKGILIYQFYAATRAHDWIHVVLNMQNDGDDSAGKLDSRELGIILGNVYICRHPL